MDKAIERYRKRRRKRLMARYDGKVEWITTESGTHIPLKDGEAVGGPLKGKKFSEAKSVKDQEGVKRPRQKVVGKKLGEKRGQINEYPGTEMGSWDYLVPEDCIREFNKKAYESIKKETGYGAKDAKSFQAALLDYTGGDYLVYKKGEKEEYEKIIDDGLKRMGAYDGPIYRGMSFNQFSDYPIDEFVNAEPGDEISMKSVSSWTSDKGIAQRFAMESDDCVLLECVENKSGVGIQHISKYRGYESEVLAPSDGKWKVTKKLVRTKADVMEEMKKEIESKESPTPREKDTLDYIKSYLKWAKAVAEKEKFIVLQVAEV